MQLYGIDWDTLHNQQFDSWVCLKMGYVHFMGKIMINHEFLRVLYLQTNLHFQVLTSDGEFFRGLTPKFAMISHRTRNV